MNDDIFLNFKKGYLMQLLSRLALLGLASLLPMNFAVAQFGGLKLPSFGGSSSGGTKTPNFGSSGLKTPSFGSSGLKTPNFGSSGIKTPSLSGIKAPTSGLGGSLKTPNLGGLGNKTPTLGGIKAPTSGLGGTLKTPTLGGNKTPTLSGIKTPNTGNLGGIKTPNTGNLGGILGGNSGPTFSGGPNQKVKPLNQREPDPIKNKPPVVNNPPKKGNGGVTSSVDWATAVKKDPKANTPNQSIVKNNPPGNQGSIRNPKNDAGVKIVTDLLGVISTIPPSQTGPNFPPQVFVPGPQPQPQPIYQPQPQPIYQPQPQQIYQPQSQPQQATYIEPAPAPQQLPRNSVVTKKQFALNPLSNPVGFNLDSTQAETDARQEIEARQNAATLDAAVMDSLNNMPNTDPNKAKLLSEWRDVVKNGSKTEDVQAFFDRNGPAGTNILPAEPKELLDMRQDFAKYADNLKNGAFTTPEERDQALTNLQTKLTTFNQTADPTLANTLQGSMTNMQNFNTMGKLAAATAELENPYPTLIQGATQMEMPMAFVSEMTGYPVMGVDPIAEQVIPTNGPTVMPAMIVLANPATTGQSVNYKLGGYPFAMAAGEDQQLDRQYVLAFDSGAGTQRQYTLGNGYYEFRIDPQTGWDIYQTKVAVTIDNSRYDGAFEYLVNGEVVRLAPGEVVEHSSDTLIEVAFHSGRDGLEHRKLLKSGQYLVGLDPAYGALDLFKAQSVEAFEAKQPAYVSSTDNGGSHASQRERVQTLLAQLKKPTAKDSKPADAVATTAGDPKNTGKKKVSALGKSKVAASPEDLLKMIKPKAGTGEPAVGAQSFEGQSVPVPQPPIPAGEF